MIQLKLSNDTKDFIKNGNAYPAVNQNGTLYTIPTEIFHNEETNEWFITDSIIRIQKWNTINKNVYGVLANLPTTPFPILVKKPNMQAEMWQYNDDSEYGHVWVTYESYRSVEEGDQWTEIQLP